ncbi:E3 ubiquitin-protein ligase UPL3-like [Hordeum vulgare subsp. vulgare]|uniref:E3 ubiquitin-protein ligase UPL3-like n=1 Tax=Hordeum vulgare subsp. vulgare TaxID=112509 RepID=UPI001D1A547F|nr:E3 ubiquitin-protein ligase UPL3-like [Hordeum vulgare subsp. vulgare]XP_044954717.1 E3 ubiquitin-protein ligase UPL3-like [Hordeum vulgare subsp. vulgare]XP_044954718.1 E3 ubiquitin-protein ligase UPL3-like [Hordeum vulgare subsp. vulgare]XP_044954719.1 E3 ubiquitin-protein ligase UPL3-like [Hordeum vulgare subsp. vulgare]XP_044954720.1 E3 ubiquitin-protein ligase UPL3-like [Hordeum vulgare subsp. vulgare]XP_044954721.1 E3 ubiquitin-protein ligase UPL3-like [Hordeum vulgare subsp. vulgare]
MIVWFLFGSLLFFLNSLRGAPIEDLCLAFTLPGFPDYVLKEGEQNIIVNIHNLEEYVSLVVDATVKSGIMKQVEAFISGFSQVFDISSLQIFSPQELDYLICGRQEIWEAKSLVDNIKFDHRFTPKSPAIINVSTPLFSYTLIWHSTRDHGEAT